MSDAAARLGDNPLRDDSVAARYLRRVLATGRLAHAYLLLGPSGSGKLDLALSFARAMHCRSGQGCGSCPSCRALEHGNHAGVTRFGPAEDKRVIDIETVRRLCERSHYRRDLTHVAILEHAELLTEPAANALLKTLEEPSPRFVLVLTAPSAGVLLPTIVSRCHRLCLSRRPEGEPESPIEGERLAELSRADFHAHWDVREWLAQTVPGASGARARVGALLVELLHQEHRRLVASGGADGATLERIALILELQGALDSNVQADLVLERLLAGRRGPRLDFSGE